MKRHVIVNGWTVRSPFVGPDGYWLVRVRRGAVVRKLATRIRDRAKALRFAIVWAEEHGADAALRPPPEKTVEHALEEWLELRVPTLRPISARTYGAIVRVLARGFPGRLVREVTPIDCERFLSNLAAKGKSPRTRAQLLSFLRSFFAWARRVHYAEEDPTAGLRIRRSLRRKGNPLSINEARLLLRAAFAPYVSSAHGDLRRGPWARSVSPPEHVGVAVAICVFSALRKKNALSLSPRHVDFAAGRIQFPPEEMKAGRELTLPLHPALGRLLRRVLKAREKMEPDAPFVGRSLLDGHRALHGACRRAGLEPRGWHDLRRSTASWLASSPSCSHYALRELLGHGVGEVTDRYVVTPFDDLVRAIESIPADVLPAEALEPTERKAGAV